jgi:TRAP-type uncharacterized transport system substrate-binding protein
MLGLRQPRAGALLIAGAFLILALLLLGLYLWSPRATLRITTGSAGGIAQRFISVFVSVSTALHPHIHFETFPVANLEESSKAMDDGKVDIALVRTDVRPPLNGQTLVILRRDIVAIILPPKSPVKHLTGLVNKTIVVPSGPLQDYDSRALDTILGYYNVTPASVKREFLPISAIGPAMREHKIAAALAIGPIGPGAIVETVASIGKAVKGAPRILEIDEGDAISKQFPAFESIDIPEGAFRGRPPIPDDTVKGLAVTYRFVVPLRMLNIVAAAIARSILKAKSNLMAVTPLASQIEAPDTDSENPLLPVHPGVAAYLSNGDQSFFDQLQEYFYVIGIPLSVAASMAAIIAGHWRSRKLASEQRQILRLLVIADEAAHANSDEIESLEVEFRMIVAACVHKLSEGQGSGDQLPVSLAVEHARRSIEARKSVLGAGKASHAAGPLASKEYKATIEPQS